MTQLSEFVGNHVGLAAAWVGILAALLWTFVQGAIGGVKKLGPTEVTQLINHQDAVVLDVRPEGEFNQGHIVNAVHVPFSSLKEHLPKLEKYRDRPIVAACRTGQQSATAGGILKKGGFENVYNLGGGILAWQGASLPLTKK